MKDRWKNSTSVPFQYIDQSPKDVPSSFKRTVLIVGIVVIVSLLIYVNQTDLFISAKYFYSSQQLVAIPSSDDNNSQKGLNATAVPFAKSIDSFDVCIHPDVDFFDPKMMEFYPKRTFTCNGSPTNFTTFEKRLLINNTPKKKDCFGRCLTFKTTKENEEGPWISTSENKSFDCEIVEARCSNKNSSLDNADYFHIHTQIVEKEPPKAKETILGKQYNLYFITIDSHSYTQQFRNLPKSNEFLTKELDAVLFPYLNRVSDGSRDNAVAWWYGKLTLKVDRTIYNLPPIKPEPKWEQDFNCKRYLDEEKFLLKEFEDYGYVTNLAEDWFRALDYYCTGVRGMLSQHHFHPYVLAYEKYWKLRNYISQKECVLRHQPLLDYFGQFIQAYKGKPKIGWSWMVHIGHNNEWESKKLDPDLYSFLQKNKEELDNSFLFIGGDHGLRYTGAAKTTLGKLDANNPLLLMTFPKELRKNKELVKTVRENAEELQTHFDTRATILDILKYQPAVNFHGREQMDIPGELGNSFLRKQPKPRNCKTLPIHVQSCICQTSINVNLTGNEPERAERLGQAVVQNINDKLKENGYGDTCRQWKVKKVDQLNLVSGSPINIEGVILANHEDGFLKEDAQFRVFATGKSDSNLEILSLDRLDRYGENGNCVAKSFHSICSCY